ncbi:MAG: serine protein kinase PrkA [Planctomycetota bacterium]
MQIESYLQHFQERSKERFQARQRIRSYREFLEDFTADPYPYLRTSARYCMDMFKHYGSEEVQRIGTKDRRWKVYDLAFGLSSDPLVGQERLQNAIFRQLLQFSQRGASDKMILLHGPNGSGKTTVVEALFRGLELYSSTPEGILCRFNWIFTEREEGDGRIGFERDEGDEDLPDSYARLGPKEISARIPCELKDSPLFLIPKDERKGFIEEIIKGSSRVEEVADLNYQYFLEGDLCPRCKMIYDALYTAYQGDWSEVIRHVQVERYYISNRYRQGAVSIEPQGNADAGTRPITYEPSVQIPAVLQNLPLYEAFGDLVDANRGIVEYSDFLKRPLEANKYLLTTSEKGTIHLQFYTEYLELVILGTANEKQLALFKRNPDFSSFKGRIELIAVPYLLMYSKEAELYERHIGHFSRGRHVTPHTATAAAMWTVLTRLRRPSAKNYPPDLAPVVSRLSPIEKAMLYDEGKVPFHLKEEERKLLTSSIRKIRDELNEAEGEFEGIYGAEYEGRRGASPREMMSLLADAAENHKYTCLTPMAVFEELEKLIRDTSVYEFLRLPVDNGYHDCQRFIEDVKAQYTETVSQEVYESIGLVEEREYERVFAEYFHHVKAYDLGEKLYLRARGEYIEPSEDLMARIEDLLSLNEPIAQFRSNLIMKIAAYSIDHPDEPINYRSLFPEIYSTLKQSFYRERDRTLTIVEQNILRYYTDEFRFLSKEEQAQVEQALERMESQYGYCKECAKDVIAFVLRSR